MAATSAIVSTMATSNGPCFPTSTSASIKTSIFTSSRNPCCLTVKPISIISPQSFHASNSCFLGKVTVRHMRPKVTPDASMKAVVKAKAADPVQDSATFLENPETSALQEKKPIQDSVKLRRKKVYRQERDPKRLNTYTAQRMVLDNYAILQYPLRTEAAVKNIASNNTLVFVVDKRADKKCIRDAARELFKIKTKKINTSIAPDGTKKAFLMLVPEQNASELAKTLRIF